MFRYPRISNSPGVPNGTIRPSGSTTLALGSERKYDYREICLWFSINISVLALPNFERNRNIQKHACSFYLIFTSLINADDIYVSLNSTSNKHY